MERILKDLGLKTQEVSITLVSDKAIQLLNKKYRGVDQPTDVLAFAMLEGEYNTIQPDILGDVVISVETAKTQARNMGHSLNEELVILLIHGILHLIGYDHIKTKEADEMMSKQETILKQIKDELGLDD